MNLAQYDHARAALAEAFRIDDILPLLDEFELAKVRAKQIKDQALLADATEYQLRAERRLGQVIEAAKSAGLFIQGRQPKKPQPGVISRPTLAEAGIDSHLSSRAQGRSSISEQAFEAMVDRTRERIASGRAKIIEAEPIAGARAIMGSRQEPDDSLDFFPTPPWATRALMEHALAQLDIISPIKRAWEPACGEGHIAEVLSEYCESVCATDVYEYGYGAALQDFLEADAPQGVLADWIITNPPFGEKTEAFVLRAIDLAEVGVAMFVRLQWLETIGRYERLFRDKPPTLISFFCERVNLCKGEWKPEGITATAYVWLTWIKDVKPRAPFWIPPGRKRELTRPDDAVRFTAHPVIKKQNYDPTTGEIAA